MATVSGTVFTDRGVTTMGSGRTVRISLNGAAGAADTTTDSSGNFSFSVTLVANQPAIVYLQGNTEVGAGIVVAIGNTNITGIHIYQDHLVLNRGVVGAATISGTQLNTADNNGDSGISAIYSSSSNSAMTMAAGKHFHTKDSTSGNINTTGSLTINLSGDLIWAGAATPNASLAVVFSGSGSKTLAGGGKTWGGAVSVSGAGSLTVTGNNTFSNTFTCASPLILTSTTQTFSSTVTLTSCPSITGGTMSKSSGTVQASSACTITSNTGSGGATFDANGATDGTGNSGWTGFAVPVTSVSRGLGSRWHEFGRHICRYWRRIR